MEFNSGSCSFCVIRSGVCWILVRSGVGSHIKTTGFGMTWL